ncbi:MAG: exodeoxyribonuclease VII large subunit [Deltaproteobacteria bacterium]|nr:exodeoxyribonuclease VII large subunit [Deltaproteobacteria bacterium]
MMKCILTVTALTGQLKNLLEETFDPILVEGEISNLRRPASGHTYFTLKDNQAQIRAVWFKPFPGTQLTPSSRRMACDLEEGMLVVCRGRISVYAPRGEYQIVIDTVEPKGTGALQKAFEQLKARLHAEGLFDERHKKEIPFLPSCIGVITSPTGAVIRDILQITKRRFPSVSLLLAPARVQGPEAAPEIVRAIQDMVAFGRADVLILARGGGSLEDLAPFNDETVARAIHACPVPIISAVGHETDYTIADFTADLRAPTPSAAAELVVPSRDDLAGTLFDLRHRMIRSRAHMAESLNREATLLREKLKSPRWMIDDYRLSLDDYDDRMKARLCQQLAHSAAHLHHLKIRLAQGSPRTGHRRIGFLLESSTGNMIAAMRRRIVDARQTLKRNISLLDSLNPLAVLNRGFSITLRRQTKEIIREAAQVRVGEELMIYLGKGQLTASVKSREEDNARYFFAKPGRMNKRTEERDRFDSEIDLPER